MEFQLGPWRIDPDARLIGRDGAPTRVSVKAMGVLIALKDAGGGVVSRDALLDTVWPEVTVGEEVVTTAVAELRRAFEDSARAQRVIQTVHKSGYRLTPGEAAPAEARALELGGEARALVAPTGAAKPSVAVLPFNALDENRLAETVADGLSRDISVGLSRTRWLFIAARASAAALMRRGLDTSEIAERLGVRYVVSGAVIADQGRLRLTVELVDAASGAEIWADKYDRALGDLFDVLAEVGEQVARAVEAEIEVHERHVARLRPISSLDAWGLFHRASSHATASDPQTIHDAERLLERAHELDPNSARILAGLATLQLRRDMFIPRGGRRDALSRGLALAEQSVDMDPRDPVALSALGRALGMAGQPEDSEARQRESVTLNPNYAVGHVYLSWRLLFNGKLDEAERHAAMAKRLSPADPTLKVRAVLAQIATLRGDLDVGADLAEEALLNLHANVQTRAIAALCSELAGRSEQARAHLADVLAERPDFSRALFFEWFRHCDAHRSTIEAAFARVGA